MADEKFSYNGMSRVFEVLHQNRIRYAVLRNYDRMLEDEIYMDGHGDIDLICEEGFGTAEVLKAYPHPGHIKNRAADGVHYYIFVNDNYVSLDLRSVGDNYYSENWQKDMLDRRIMKDGFYVLSDQDYFYSLIYHAIFQKEKLTEEYRNRLSKMAESLVIKTNESTERDFIGLLEEFMRKNNYHYLYPKDFLVPFREKMIIDKSLLKLNRKDCCKRKRFELKIGAIAFLVQIKHLFKKPKS